MTHELADFLANPNLRPISRDHYEFTIKRLQHFLDDKPWEAVTAADITRYLDTLHNVITKKSYLGIFKTFFKWVHDGTLTPDLQRLTLKDALRFRPRLQAEQLLTNEEVEWLVSSCTSLRDKTLIMLLYGTGCRIGELRQLRVRDVVDIQGQTAIRVNGKTGEHYYYVSLTALPYLRQYLQSIHGASPGSSLFPLAYRGIHALLRRAAQRAGITKRIYPHLFRHMRNTRLVRKIGKDKAKRVMGYAPSSDVIENYTHLTEQDTVAAFLESEGLPVEAESAPPDLAPPVPVKCPRCQFDNVPASNFCARCTLPLHGADDEETVAERLARMESAAKTLLGIVHRLSDEVKVLKQERLLDGRSGGKT